MSVKQKVSVYEIKWGKCETPSVLGNTPKDLSKPHVFAGFGFIFNMFPDSRECYFRCFQVCFIIKIIKSLFFSFDFDECEFLPY